VTPTAQALDRIIRREDEYASVLMTIYDRKFTGSFTVHCIDGVPKRIDFPGVQVQLTGGSLDNLRKLADPT